MTLPNRRSTLAALLGAASSAGAQKPAPSSAVTEGASPSIAAATQAANGTNGQRDILLPNGKSQRDEILKAERDQNLKDAAELVDLAQQLQRDVEKNDALVFSLTAIKKTDNIEKLAKKIRSRMRH
jgi:hypothetical protein